MPSLAEADSVADRQRAAEQARRHSTVVRVLKMALPVCALALCGLYFISWRLTVSIGDFEASVKTIEVSRERLRMIEPKLEGVTKKNGTYTVTAEFAEQEVSKPGIVYLTTVRADVDNPDQGWTRMTAPSGTFDTKQETLTLTGDIQVASSSGLKSRLTRADINMRTQKVVSEEPVLVQALNGTINSKTMEIQMTERIVIFRGDIRVHIYKRPAKSEPKQTRGTSQ